MTTDFGCVYSSATQEGLWCADTQTIPKGRFETVVLFA